MLFFHKVTNWFISKGAQLSLTRTDLSAADTCHPMVLRLFLCRAQGEKNRHQALVQQSRERRTRTISMVTDTIHHLLDATVFKANRKHSGVPGFYSGVMFDSYHRVRISRILPRFFWVTSDIPWGLLHAFKVQNRDFIPVFYTPKDLKTTKPQDSQRIYLVKIWEINLLIRK